MTPTYLNSSPSLFLHDQKEDQHHQVLLSTPNLNSSSSSSLSYHIFLNSGTKDHSDQQEGDNFATNGGSYEIENESDHSGLKFSIWKQEIKDENQSETTNIHQVKWMSSKMRLMHKMKKSDQTVINAPTSTTFKVEDDQKQQSPPMGNDNSSINATSNSSSNNSPIIRVCSDCNTTKTPLWRSGPRDKQSNNGQKRCKFVVAPSLPPSQGREKLCFEDFLISLSKNLAFHRVFPQDEKDAAILLMALSCGHVHG
ncbi:hypothetical protein LguiA_020121 [Lonicera macranthoides]